MEKKGWLTSGADNIAILKVATDGGGNSFWLKGGTAYTAILSTMTTALSNLDRNQYNTIDISGLLYLQGESDGGAEITEAATRYAALIANLQEDLGAQGYEGVTVTLGQSILGEPANNTASKGILKDYADAHENAAWVITNDLSKIEDNLHFSGVSQLTIGARYAYNTALLNGLDVGTVRSQENAALDTKSAWWGDGLNKLSTTVAEWDISSSNTIHRISDVAGTHLAMYGIKISDTYLDNGTITIQGELASGATTPSLNDTTLAIGEGGITIGGMVDDTTPNTQYKRNLVIASNVELTSDQIWSLSGGSSLTIKGASPNSSTSIISGNGNVNLVKQQNTTGRALFNISQVDHQDHQNIDRTWTLGTDVDLCLNQSSAWENNTFQIEVAANASIGGLGNNALTLGTLSLGDNSTFSLGGSSLLDLSVNNLIFGTGVSLTMDIRNNGADMLRNLNSGVVNINGLTFNFDYRSGLTSKNSYTIMENVTGDLNNIFWNSQVSNSLSSSLQFVDGNLIITFTGSGSPGITWPAYSLGCDAMTADTSTFNARAASNITSGTVSTRTNNIATETTLQYYYANSGAYTGDVYGELNGLVYTWASATGSGSGYNFNNNTLTGNAYLKIKGDYKGSSVNGTIFGAVNATVTGNVYIELDATNITYGQNGTFNSVSGAYNSQINGSLDILINRGTFTKDVYAGIISGATRSIKGGVSLFIKEGTFSSVVAGGGKDGTIEKGINMTINSGTFNGDVYGGGTGGTVNGNIIMNINDGVFNSALVAGGGNNTVNGDVELTISNGNFENCTGIYAGVNSTAGKVVGRTTITLTNINDSHTIANYTGILSGGNAVAGSTAISGQRSLVLDNYTASSIGMQLKDLDSISLINNSSTAMTWAQLNTGSSVHLETGSTVKMNGTGNNNNTLLLNKAGLFSGNGTIALTAADVYYVIQSQLMSGSNSNYTGLRLDAGTLIINDFFAETSQDTYDRALCIGDFSGSGNVSGKYGKQPASTLYRYIRTQQSTKGTLVYSGTFAAEDNRSVGLVKDGVGTLVLTGNNTSLADLSIQGGTLQIGNGGPSGNWTGAIKVAAGGKLIWNNATTATRAGTTVINGTFSLVNNGNLTLATATGAGILEAKDTATLTVQNMSNFSGTTSVGKDATLSTGGSWDLEGSSLGGTLNLLEGSTVKTGMQATYGNKWTLAQNATIEVNDSAGVMGGISATKGTLTKTGAGDFSFYETNNLQGLNVANGTVAVVGVVNTEKLSGNGNITVKGTLNTTNINDYSGKITLSGGIIDLQNQTALGNAIIMLESGTIANFNNSSPIPTEITIALTSGSSQAEFYNIKNVSLVAQTSDKMLLSPQQTITICHDSSISVGMNTIGLTQGNAAFIVDSTSTLYLNEQITLDLSGWTITNSLLEIKLADFGEYSSGDIVLGQHFSLILQNLSPGKGYDSNSFNFNDLRTTGNVYVKTFSIPEPSSATLGLLALSGLLFRRRRVQH